MKYKIGRFKMNWLVLATVVLGVLKLAGYISITWLWVFSPLIIGLGLLFALTLFFPFLAFGAVFSFAALTVIAERICEYFENKEWRYKDGKDNKGDTC